jgi:rod shape-determining protein MreD
MKRLLLPFILFLFVVLEGVALELLPSKLVMGNLLIVPHWVLVFLVFLAVFYDYENTYFSVLYGIIFGLLIDVVYTGVLGVYMFSYAIVIYIVHGLKKMLHGNIYVTLLLGFIGVALADSLIHFIFKMVGLTDTVWTDYFTHRLLPTVILNLVFLLILYPIFVKRLTTWGREHLTKSNSI